QVVSAQVYECEFNRNQTCGWAPEKMYIDNDRELVFSFTQGGVRFTGSNPYFWRENLRASNGGFKSVRYRLRVGQDIEAGEPVYSSIRIEVTGSQSEETRGSCKLYTG
ncbi:MAG: hypothetical protein AAF386_13120, partial [Pseudomonadota bacterium]